MAKDDNAPSVLLEATEAALTQTRKNLQEAQHLAHIGSWEWDILANTVVWSEEQYRLFGENPSTYKPDFDGYLSHLSGPDREATVAALRTTLEGKGDYSIEHEILCGDASVRFVAEKGRLVFGKDGKPERIFGTTQDITERKRHEAALKAKQRELEVQATFLQSIVENIPMAVFIKDIRNDFRVTLWNKAAEDIFQVRKEEIIGKTAHDLWPKDQADLYLEADRRVARDGRLVEVPEEPSRTKDRGTIYLNTVKVPLRIKEGVDPEYLLAISSDITKQKQGNAELKTAKEAAENANRAKDEFLAMMSHEIRTPMNGVMGMTQLLKATPLSKEQAEMVATLEYSGGILLSVIDDILDYSKIEAGQLRVEVIPFALEDPVREVAGMLAPQAAQKGLGLTVNLPPERSLPVLGDPGRIRQVAINLIGNAIKFTRSGSITVQSRLADGGRLALDVIDTGIGIPEESRPRIFRKFSQADASTSRRFGGTGLGLAISKHLMELMGGELEFTSVPGRGSTFSLLLPLAEAARGGIPANPADPSPALETPLGVAAERSPEPVPDGNPEGPLTSGPRVLLAEDNPVNQKVGLNILSSLGCRVDLARSGFEAMEMIKTNAYDLVLMDIQMPGMDGLEATRQIRAWETERDRSQGPDGSNPHPRLRIIALSAGVLQDDREIAARAGMDGFLTKPVFVRELARVLRPGA